MKVNEPVDEIKTMAHLCQANSLEAYFFRILHSAGAIVSHAQVNGTTTDFGLALVHTDASRRHCL